MLEAKEDGEPGKGEGLCAEVVGVGLEGTAIAECKGECGTLWDLYYESFPEGNCRKGRRNVEKPWLDDLVKEEGLYSRKLRGQLTEEGV